MQAERRGGPKARIVLFSGGTACRTTNISLSRRGYALTRIVPAWDSGGSSKVLRETFDMIPVGDIRQALMTMAHGEGRDGAIIRIFNARLSADLPPQELWAELDYYVSGEHPLISRMSEPMRVAVLAYLRIFKDRAGPDFDLRNGSVGNFVLTGAYLAHNRDISRAITDFRQLCRIDGNVWPAALDDDIQLQGRLKDGREIKAQHLLTKLGAQDASIGIDDVWLVRSKGAPSPAIGEMARAAIEKADLIVFGPGSFYTSILPHLQVAGAVEAIAANARAAKVFVGNILADDETIGATLSDLLQRFLARPNAPAMTHVLSNRELFPFEKRVGKQAYLRSGALNDFCAKAHIANAVGDFEDAWVRGQHDGEAVADALGAILQERAAQT